MEDPKATQSAKVGALTSALARGFRKRLPDACRGVRQKAKIGNHTLYLHTGEYEDGTLGEVFVDIQQDSP